MSEFGQKLIKATREAAEKNPDYIYERAARDGNPGSCMYVHHGKPSCIVGHAAWDIGLIGAEFERNDDNQSSVDGLLSYFDQLANLTDEERCWLQDVQGTQDNGTPWGEAVRKADDAWGEYFP